MCGKNRFLIEGKSICKKCNNEGLILCRGCGKSYPAGLGDRCSSCYFLDLLDRKLNLSLGGLESENLQLVFRQYSEWLLRQYGSQKAAVVINKHFNFFREIDQRWHVVPPYETLLDFYGADGLRRHRMPMRFLDETKLIRVNQDKKNYNSEARKIDRIVDGFNGDLQAKLVLNHYRMLLLEAVENKEVRIRTVRLYLRASASLLEFARIFPLVQKDVNAYLNKKPGQAASLTRFVSYMNAEWGTELEMPHDKHRHHRVGKSLAEKKLVRLLKDSGDNASYEDKDILSAALEYYHGMPPKVASTEEIALRKEDLHDGEIATIQGFDYWLPRLIAFAH